MVKKLAIFALWSIAALLVAALIALPETLLIMAAMKYLRATP